jgi:glycosidase
MSAAPVRPRIYQLFLRQFSNTNETRQPNGTLAQNGCGRFADLDDRALAALQELGVTELWLHGILRQASATDYSAVGLPADDPDLLKGLAGSPYAVRDVCDVSPDYAVDPARRREEFQDLLVRIHSRGMRVVIDFVPNHVARSHHSVVRPDLNYGAGDDRTRFFAPNNHFYYLEGTGPLRLPTVQDGRPVSPTCQVTGGCDGLFEDERDHGKVTGNNANSWSPGAGDWYETVKLNYGHDFRAGRHGGRAFPTPERPETPIPDTWHKQDAVLAHWQSLGVDGFRCDMAHWVPLEFWQWAVARARVRDPGVRFLGEAYDNDPNKLTDGNVLTGLVGAGFDAVYDHQSYQLLQGIYDGPKWANDLDAVLGAVAPLHQSVRYAENHDEVRLAHPGSWGGVGAQVGRPVTALLFGVGRGPLLLYNGQEVGEPAATVEGFGGGQGRTSIFDYGSMPELAKWVNGHRYDGGRLSPGQRELRQWYAHLLAVCAEPALSQGEFHPLNGVNGENPAYGRLPGESASGHWLYTYLRHDPASGQRFLVVVNLHPQVSLREVRIRFSAPALAALGIPAWTGSWRFTDRLAGESPVTWEAPSDDLRGAGLRLPELPPLTAWYLEVVR